MGSSQTHHQKLLLQFVEIKKITFPNNGKIGVSSKSSGINNNSFSGRVEGIELVSVLDFVLASVCITASLECFNEFRKIPIIPAAKITSTTLRI
ncbi:MAG: hypothetical protein IPK14_21320 [Blastocatellia bacterium]|nr:hypothetical protein [Blastocatellia bacterium]